jgi:hypothetical protein
LKIHAGLEEAVDPCAQVVMGGISHGAWRKCDRATMHGRIGRDPLRA